MNNRGQALVEFIIVLPILIFILFGIIDYGMISYNRNRMENIIDDVNDMYKNNETDDEVKNFIKSNDKDMSIDIIKKDRYISVKLNKKYNYITPGLNKIFKDDNIKVERKIYNE